MRIAFLKCLLVALFSCFGELALAQPDPPPPATPPPAAPPPATPPPATPPATVTLTKEQFDELMGRAKPPATPPPEPDLNDRVAKERAAKEKADADSQVMEKAVAYNLGLDKLVADNKDLLPPDVADLVKASLAETYESQAAKASAVKAAIIKSYFSVQENYELLTIGQKADIDKYNKLTKTAKEEHASAIYANLFEPTLESQRRVRKAEELNRGRSGSTPSGSEAAHREKMIAAATKKYLGK